MIVLTTLHHHFGHWTQLCAAVSSTGAADCSSLLHQLLSAPFSSAQAWLGSGSLLLPCSLQLPLSTVCLGQVLDEQEGNGQQRGRAYPDSLPNGEREAKTLHVQGCSPFLPPETTPAVMLWLV